MITKQHSFACVIVPVLLGVWMDVARGMSIQLTPQYPVIGGSVTLSVTGITGRFQAIIWFKGPTSGLANVILLYVPDPEPTTVKGLSFHDRISVSPNGSLMISNLNTADEGDYTAKIQTDKPNDITVYMKIYESLDNHEYDSMNDSSETVWIGSVISVAVVILLVLIAVLAYLYVRHRRHMKQSSNAQTASEALVYENVASRSHTNETTLPGIPAQGTQDSHYEQLTHKDRTVYSILASKDIKS